MKKNVFSQIIQKPEIISTKTITNSHPTDSVPHNEILCRNCSYKMMEGSCCRECHQAIDYVCHSCNTITWHEMHEMCLCQPYMLSSIMNSQLRGIKH